MIDKEVKRGHEKVNGEFWAFTEEKFENGDGNDIIRIIKEKVNLDYVNKTLDTLIQKKSFEIDENISKTKKGIKETEKRNKDLVNTREYLEFKKYFESDEFKKFNAIHRMEQNKIDIDDLLKFQGYQEKYNKLKTNIQDKDFKQHFITYKDEENLFNLKNQLDNLNSMKKELEEWKTQFSDLKLDMEKENGEKENN